MDRKRYLGFIDHFQFVVTVPCFHRVDVMVPYGRLRNQRVCIRGPGSAHSSKQPSFPCLGLIQKDEEDKIVTEFIILQLRISSLLSQSDSIHVSSSIFIYLSLSLSFTTSTKKKKLHIFFKQSNFSTICSAYKSGLVDVNLLLLSTPHSEDRIRPNPPVSPGHSIIPAY